jgi:hypothetical protein
MGVKVVEVVHPYDHINRVSRIQHPLARKLVEFVPHLNILRAAPGRAGSRRVAPRRPRRAAPDLGGLTLGSFEQAPDLRRHPRHRLLVVGSREPADEVAVAELEERREHLGDVLGRAHRLVFP